MTTDATTDLGALSLVELEAQLATLASHLYAGTCRSGQPFPTVPTLPRGHPDELLERNRDHEIDERTCEPGTGERLDLALAVDAVIHALAPSIGLA